MKEKSKNSIGKLSTEARLQNAINQLSLQNEVMNKRAQELISANKLRLFESNEKAARADELIIANKELAFQNKEKEKRAAELVIANKELAFHNEEKEKRAAELAIANKELAFQNKEKEKRAAELFIANKELKGIIAERKKAEEALNTLNEELEQRVNEKTETVLKTLEEKNIILESFGDAFFALDSNWTVTYWNHVAEQNLGVKKNDIIGKNLWEIFPGSEDTISYRNHHHAMETKQPMHFEDYYSVLNIWHEISSYPSENGLSIFFKDITERKIVEEKLIKSNRMYAFTSAINQMIVKTTDEIALYNQACSIAVDIGKFKMAWIGRIDEETKKVIPVVHAGVEDDYLNKMIPISIDDIPEGRGPTGTAIREGRYIVCNNIENDPRMVPWKEAAAERGYLSCIAFPIRKFGKVLSAYSLYAPVKNFFDDTEITLLEEAVGDISFAMESLEKANLHQIAENKIIESEEVFRRLFDESADATLLLDNTGFIRCNKSAVSILGYDTKEEIMGRQPWEISPEKQPDKKLSKVKAKAMIAKALKNGYNRFEWLHLKADGTVLHVEVMLTPITLKGVQSFYTIWRDITGRKKAIKEIQDYKFALDESSLVDISDSNGKIKYANENFRRLSKYSQEELFDQDHRILNSGYHPIELFRNLWATVQAGKIWRNEVRNRAKDGSFFWVDTTIVPFLDNNGKPFQFITIRTDITERKKTEQKLIDSYALSRIAGEIAKLGGWNVNLEENRVYWSDEVAAIHEMPAGYAPLVEEGINFYAPEWRDKITEVFTNCVQKGISYDEDMEILTSSGKRIWVRTNGEAVRDAQGKIVKVQGAFQDITERKNSEVALIESEQEVKAMSRIMKSAQEIAHLGSFEYFFADQTTIWSEEEYRIYGLDPTGPSPEYNVMLEKCIHPDDAKLLHDTFLTAMHNKQVYELEHRIVRPDGGVRWVYDKADPYFDQDGNILRYVGATLDVTDQKQTELDRQKITDDLLHRNQDLEQFAYMVSHNLRAPVANIKGLSDLLGDESLSKDEAESVTKKLLSSVSKLNTVILDLNDILQLKKGVSNAKERVVFAELVNEIEESIHTLMFSENVKIVAQFDEVAEMLTLKSYLYSIFYNLISNSIKYKRRDIPLVIEIKSFRRKNEIELVFKDNGIGIDLKNRGDQVFGLYKRFHPEIEGKGMGLFMVKAQVEALGGKILIESEVNQGTEFKIIFATEKNYDN